MSLILASSLPSDLTIKSFGLPSMPELYVKSDMAKFSFDLVPEQIGKMISFYIWGGEPPLLTIDMGTVTDEQPTAVIYEVQDIPGLALFYNGRKFCKFSEV